MDPRLSTALGLVAEAAREARDPWWVIGSAAMALHGADLQVGDVDLLMSRADAARLLERHGRTPEPGSRHDKFRSDVFGRLDFSGYTIEVMGGFHVHDGADWREVAPRSRILFCLGDAELFAPSLEDLIDMCRLFGRLKDAERERVLELLRNRSD